MIKAVQYPVVVVLACCERAVENCASSYSILNNMHFPLGVSHGDNRGTHLFTWGAGYHGQLGRKFQRGHKKYSPMPKLVPLPRNEAVVVRQISCGGLHTAIVTGACSAGSRVDGGLPVFVFFFCL